MKRKTIYLIRHGETDYNKQGIVQGSGIDSELNKTGHGQAAAFYKKYGDTPFDKVYTSALQRTHQSVANFIKDGVPHKILTGLNEISWGKTEGKKPSLTEDAFYWEIIKKWKTGETHLSMEDGESPEDVIERQKAAIEHIIAQEHEELILVAMHGRAIRILLTLLSEIPVSKMDNFKHSNLCLYKLEYSYQTKSFKILEHNITDHLTLIPA
ncbi:histidine phosphatase family protein [Arcticibacterium luteifluviistationis]|uniref:Histidine phosphatase family protein n=1 Tax=Arcticibacterium luteifluviistationis TaxID=1784714 RepID=A0A2Z4GCY7_9BACT|nr:histidine phosphatase family protein [Arcticibacterium luteifluviistationis]AWV98977.1 histidine phosphatase family protein [Arcticibacterium luteifluviistationis]